MKEINNFFNKKGETLYLIASDEAIEFLNNSIESDFITSLRTISDKGIFQTLIEACSKNKVGFDITSDAELEKDEFLHGQTKYKVIVSVTLDQEDDFVDSMFNNGIETTLLGHTTKGELRMDDESFGFISEYAK